MKRLLSGIQTIFGSAPLIDGVTELGPPGPNGRLPFGPCSPSSPSGDGERPAPQPDEGQRQTARLWGGREQVGVEHAVAHASADAVAVEVLLLAEPADLPGREEWVARLERGGHRVIEMVSPSEVWERLQTSAGEVPGDGGEEYLRRTVIILSPRRLLHLPDLTHPAASSVSAGSVSAGTHSTETVDEAYTRFLVGFAATRDRARHGLLVVVGEGVPLFGYGDLVTGYLNRRAAPADVERLIARVLFPPDGC